MNQDPRSVSAVTPERTPATILRSAAVLLVIAGAFGLVSVSGDSTWLGVVGMVAALWGAMVLYGLSVIIAKLPG